ncbi:hypothetical protein PsYK624_100180 [Phanerochaete sordida]|uniref:DNA polymerase delta subunit 4 n=1 Tax=Phanerochaete sordida TaxID=48140 RepID=A0A9P3GGG3_9APHY|nr:hypothetical protein PsYK624_100180 [Phanerochaete sordida]
MPRQSLKPKTLRQSSLSFPSKRSTATEAKEKHAQPSASATPTPRRTTDISDIDDVIDIPDTSDIEEMEPVTTSLPQDDEVELLSDDEPVRAPAAKATRGKRAASRKGKAAEQEDEIVDEIEEEEEEERPKKKRRVSSRTAKSAAASIEAPVEDEPGAASTKKGKGRKGKKSLAKSVFGSREGVENSESNTVASWKDESKKTKLTAKGSGKNAVAKHVDIVKMREHFGYVRAQQGNVMPIHAENHSMEDHILRFFDLSYQYGPCIGITRLQRWDRAQSLGMSPPEVVKQLLTNEDGSERAEVKECVFFGQV